MDRQIESCPVRFASVTHTCVFGCSGTHITCIHPIKLKRIVLISILYTNLCYNKNSRLNRSHLQYRFFYSECTMVLRYDSDKCVDYH